MKRIAVIGSGIAGLAAARGLTPHAQVTLFEAADRFGGHAHTVDVSLGGRAHGVDIGFSVFDESAAPRFAALLAELGVATAPAEMSFSAQIPAAGLEWSSAGLGGVFAQPGNLLRLAFWNMLGEIPRFNRHAAALARLPPDIAHDDSVGDFLAAHRFSKGFRDWYLLPLLGCIWSCPSEQMMRMPAAAMARFCRDHGLLGALRRPRARSIAGGADVYVRRLLASLADARLRRRCGTLRRLPIGGVGRLDRRATERFDAVVFACHSVDVARARSPTRAPTSARCWAPSTTSATGRSCTPMPASCRCARPRGRHGTTRRAGDRRPTKRTPVCVHVLINRAAAACRSRCR